MGNLLLSSLLIAGSLVASSAAQAQIINYNTDPSGDFTASFENPDPAAEFNDLFAPFTIMTSGFLSGEIVTTGVTAVNDLDFSLARIENSGGSTVLDFFPLEITAAGGNPDAKEEGGFLYQPIAAGTYRLRVAGQSPGANGSYAGTLSFSPAAVPEAATWGMLLIGFGGIGTAMRRRKVRTKVQFA
jgi:hypothetical protein